MKRYLTILLSLLLLCAPIFAQSGTANGGGEISQTGEDLPQLSISHPLDSDEEFAPDSDILVTPIIDDSISIEEAPQPIASPVIDDPVPVAATPSDVTINLEIKIISDTDETRLSVPIPPGTTNKSVTAEIGSGTSTQTAAPPPVTTRIEPESSLVPGRDIRVIPGMPDPNSGKTYRLQVGAYSVEDNASVSAAQLRSGGFKVEREVYNSMYRVLAVGIPARDVYDAVKRIGELGFSVVWVRE